MKLALDVWYELWENAGSGGGLGPDRHPDEEDHHYPLPEDYLGGSGTRKGIASTTLGWANANLVERYGPGPSEGL